MEGKGFGHTEDFREAGLTSDHAFEAGRKRHPGARLWQYATFLPPSPLQWYKRQWERFFSIH